MVALFYLMIRDKKAGFEMNSERMDSQPGQRISDMPSR